MRAGAYTIHQSLTAEAAAVLKLAVAIARRRGHAQVTPLHVAFALLTPACSPPPHPIIPTTPPPPYGLLKRACLRSHPPAAAAHPLQCRALELCFNVALNRLPTSSPPHSQSSPPPPQSSPPFASSLIQPNPTLSNALVAALKRAQANQRRGCVELQQQPPPPPPMAAAQQPQQQQQQPLLAIKVELDQLMISILDDPSVSRVMREAGFSSSTVKSNLEEESAALITTTSSPPPPHFFMMWPPPPTGTMAGVTPMTSPPSNTEDVRAVLEVMVRRNGRRNNPVVVGDSVSMAESVAGELLRRLEDGGEMIPDELAGAHILKLQLSYVHVRLMSRADVDAKAAELRRSVDGAVRLRGGGGLVVYVGDLRWALDDDSHHHNHTAAASYSPVDHMVNELGRLRGPGGGRVWIMATASYQTYMRCRRRRRPSLESTWALQAVVVPTASATGLALNNLHTNTTSNTSNGGAPMQQAMVATKQQQLASPFAMAAEPFALEQEDKMLVLCTECSRNYEREASAVKAEAAADEEGPLAGNLPGWLVPEAPKEKYLIDLKRKWSRLCRKLHLCGGDPCSAPPFGAGAYGSGGPTLPWWSASCLLPTSAAGSTAKPAIAGFLGMDTLQWSPPSSSTAASHPRHRGMSSLRDTVPECHDVTTALSLGSLPLSDSASSSGGGGESELEQRLRESVPWQRAAVAEIAHAVSAAAGAQRSGVWLLLKGGGGGDHAAVGRAAAVIAETRCGGADRVVSVDDPSKFGCAEDFCSDIVSRGASMAAGGDKTKLVLVVGDVERALRHVVDCLVAAARSGAMKDNVGGREIDLSDSIVILTTSKFSDSTAAISGGVISLRLYTSDDSPSPSPPSGDHKRRKAVATSPPSDRKRARRSNGLDLNLNLFASDDDDDEEQEDGGAVPSDITDECDSGDHRNRLLENVATRVVNLKDAAAAAVRERLSRRGLRVDGEAAEALAAATGHVADEVMERWVEEVFEPAAATVKNGGKTVVVLGVGPGGGGGAQESGFMGSVLPSRVHVN
uniref:Clp R domain-containing protein n=1 Tax=Leersia perrieri TaxID=77586 RepID=A0A0D9W3A1_9ORYZ